MLRAIHAADAAMNAAVARGATAEEAGATPSLARLARMRAWPAPDANAKADSLIESVESELEQIG
jgi:hypothetical protein